MGVPPNRHGSLLHSFQERALGLGGSAIDLIRQDHIRKQGSRLESKAAPSVLVLLQNGRTGNVGRHEIRGELNARKLKVEDMSQCSDQQGLSQTGHSFK